MSTEQDILAGRINAAMEEWDALVPGECETHMASHIAGAILATGYSKRETVTEWAAAFPQTGNVYNFHRTREEAQAFVDGMAEVGADMVVMTREVLPQDASDWRAAE